MRRVASYGGPSGVPGSQRLKHKLSLTPGLHLLSTNSLQEGGFLDLASAAEESHDERVIHRTSRATRNFYATSSTLSQIAKKEPWLFRKDSFVPAVKERTIFDEPVEAEKRSDAEGPSLHEEILDGNITSGSQVDENGEVVLIIPNNFSPVLGEAYLEKTFSAPCPSDHLTNGTDSVPFNTGDGVRQGTDLPNLGAVSNVETSSIDLSLHDTSAQPLVVETGLDHSESQEAEASTHGGACDTDLPNLGVVSNVEKSVIDLSLHATSAKPFIVGTGIDHGKSQQAEASADGGACRHWVSDDQHCELGQLGMHEAVDDLPGRGSLLETQPPSTALAELKVSSFTSPPHPDQGAGTFPAGESGADSTDNGDILGIDKPELMGSGGALQDSENGTASVQCKIMAAVEIQRWCRGWLQRKHFKQIQERLVIVQSLGRAAVVLQKHWRALQSRRLVKHMKMEWALKEEQRVDSAIVMLQKHWRGQQSRCLVKNLKMEQATREQQQVDYAAVVLQKYWRAQQSRRLVNQLKLELVVKEQQRMDHAAVVLQKYWRAGQSRHLVKCLKMEEALRQQDIVDNAAIVLQKHWRAQQSRRFVDQLKMEQVVREQQRMDDAAVVLQKYWRAGQGRHLVKCLQLEQALEEQEMVDNATLVLQKHWRAQQSRHLVKYLRIQQALREQEMVDNAAIVLQKHWRTQQSRRLVNQLKTERVMKEQQRMDHAAVVLQKHWRAQQSRRLVNQIKVEQVVREQQRMDDAAVMLQKHWRAQQSRLLVKYLKMKRDLQEQEMVDNAAIVLQKHWRAQQSRRLVNQLRMEQVVREQQRMDDAAVVLQKYWRAGQSRHLVKYLKLEQAFQEQKMVDNAALVLQKHWRAQQSRRLVNRLKLEEVVREQQRVHDAAVVLQKYWRAGQSRQLVKYLKLEQALREQKVVDNAAIVLQKHWRAQESRRLVNQLKMEQVVRKQHRMDHAAVVVQRYWNARQSRHLVEYLRMKRDMQEQEMVDNAAIVLQKHWRAQQSRRLVDQLKMQEVVREQQRMDQAAVVMQKYWRAQQSRHLVKFLRMQQALREEEMVTAAIVLQKHWRTQQSRRVVNQLKLEQVLREQHRMDHAAVVLQKYWRAGQSRQLVKYLKLEQALQEQKVVDNAAIVLQKHWRAQQSRLLVHQLRMEGLIREQHRMDHAAVVLQKYWRAQQSRHLVKYLKMVQALQEQKMVENAAIVLQKLWRAQQSRRLVKCLKLEECNPCSILELDREFSAATVGELDVQNNEVQEDWNYVSVDHLEECLDTYLAVHRPLPPTLSTFHVAQHGLSLLDLPEEAQQLSSTDQPVESIKIADKVLPSPEMSSTTHDTSQQVPSTSLGTSESGSNPSIALWNASGISKSHMDQVTSQSAPLIAADHKENSSGPQQEANSEQTENPVHCKSLRRQTLKQNEHRLKQFAQVFLLQRQIALQQQRAQAAPPFPPPMQCGSGFCSQDANPSSRVENGDVCYSGDRGQVALQDTDTHTDASPSSVVGGRPEEHDLICEIVDSKDLPTLREQSPGSQKLGVSTKQVVESPGPDVVLDMVLLLRRIEGQYGTSETDFEGKSSPWLSSRDNDIEEGLPLLDRNLVRHQNSVANFPNCGSVQRMSIPDVNSILLVLIAMVVYTRTVCQGVLFGTRQTHRRT